MLGALTVCCYHRTLRMFCDYLTDAGYDWTRQCRDLFDQVPIQVCHEWNTVAHLNAHEGRPARRPFTYDELQGSSTTSTNASSGLPDPGAWAQGLFAGRTDDQHRVRVRVGRRHPMTCFGLPPPPSRPVPAGCVGRIGDVDVGGDVWRWARASMPAGPGCPCRPGTLGWPGVGVGHISSKLNRQGGQEPCRYST